MKVQEFLTANFDYGHIALSRLLVERSHARLTTAAYLVMDSRLAEVVRAKKKCSIKYNLPLSLMTYFRTSRRETGEWRHLFQVGTRVFEEPAKPEALQRLRKAKGGVAVWCKECCDNAYLEFDLCE